MAGLLRPASHVSDTALLLPSAVHIIPRISHSPTCPTQPQNGLSLAVTPVKCMHKLDPITARTLVGQH